MNYFWKTNPALRVLIPFILGICSHSFITIPVEAFIIAIAMLLFLLIILNYVKSLSQIIYLIGQILLLIALGNQACSFHSIVEPTEKEVSGKSFYLGTIDAKKVGAKFTRFILSEVKRLDRMPATSKYKTVIYSKIISDSSFVVGDQIVIRTELSSINSKSNVKAFDFEKYWKTEGVYFQGFVEKGNISMYKKARPDYIFKLRKYIASVLENNLSDEESISVAKALFIGDKSFLDPETKSIYQEAGAMHVLAVSGLHIGIVYMLFSLPLLLISRLLKRKLTAFNIIILIPIWVFAFICDLTPSVYRASLMITFLVISQIFSSKYSSLNILAIVAFVLLFFNPKLLVDVGFQFSFMAVLGIVFCYRPINKLLVCSQFILSKIWSMIAMTISAQVFLFPLLLYYFHQFPLYFIPNSLIAVMAVFLILFVGLALLMLDGISGAGQILGYLLEWMINGLHDALSFMVSMPMTMIDDIWINESMLLILIGVSMLISVWLISSKNIYGLAASIFLLLFSVLYAHQTITYRSNKFLAVYENKGDSVIGLYDDHRGYLVSRGEPNDYVTRNLHSFLNMDSIIQISADRFYYDPYSYFNRGLLMASERHILVVDDRNQDYFRNLQGGNFEALIYNGTNAKIVDELVNSNTIKKVILFCKSQETKSSYTRVCKEGIFEKI